MRKTHIWLLCAVLLLVVPAAASAKTLTVWMPPYGSADTMDKEFWETQLAKFAEHKGIDEVVVEITPWEGYEQKYMTAVVSGNAPDVGYMYMEMFSDFIDVGAVEPLDGYVTQADFDNYLYLTNGYIKGQLYAFPFIVGNPRMIFVNMDILKDCGLDRAPQTWDEVVEWGKNIKEKRPDVYPLLEGWGDTDVSVVMNLYYPLMVQAGGSFLNAEQNALAIGSPEAVKAAQFLYDLRFTHDIMPDVVTSLNGDDVINAFVEGKTAMVMSFAYKASGVFEPAGMNWDFAVLKDSKMATIVACDNLVMLSSSVNKDLAYECIKYMTSGEVMGAFHQQLSAFPPIAKDEAYHDLEVFKPMYENPEIEMYSQPAIKGFYMVNEALYKNLQLMLMGSLTAEQAIADTLAYAETVVEF